MRPTQNRSGMSQIHLQDRLHRSMQARADFVPERSPAEIDEELARITTVPQADEGMRRQEPALAALPAFLSIACAIIVLAGCVALMAVFHAYALAVPVAAGGTALLELLRFRNPGGEVAPRGPRRRRAGRGTVRHSR